MHASKFRRLTTVTAVLTGAALIAAGCGDDSDSSSDSKSKGSTTSQSDSSDSSGDDATMSKASSVISSPGVDLRTTLGRLFAEHAGLAVFGLQKTVAGEKDAEAVVGALAGNTDDLTAAVASVYGEEAGDAFKTQWEAHIGFFVDYATGVATKDQAKQDKAKADLAGYQKSFAKFLNEAAGLDAKAAEAALGMHVQQIIAAVDAFAAKSYAKGYASEREAYMHMVGTADALAGAISEQKPDDFGTGDVNAGAADTRQLVGTQLGEHAFLATVALTKTMAGAKDAPDAVKALDANSVALGKTIGSVYGPDAEKAFMTQWRAHIGFFVTYATGVATDDQAMQDKGRKDLEGYAESFSKFLAEATGGDQAAFKDALEMHAEQLMTAIDQAGAGDADAAWKSEREAYAHMYGTADALVTAIVEQNPDKFGGEASASTEESSDSMSDM